MALYKDNVEHIDNRMIRVGGEERPKFCWRMVGGSLTSEKYRYCQADYCMAWDVEREDCIFLHDRGR